MLNPFKSQTTYTWRTQTEVLAPEYSRISKLHECLEENNYFLLHLLGKRRHHDKGNAAVLKFVDIFEPKLQFMFFLHVLVDSLKD